MIPRHFRQAIRCPKCDGTGKVGHVHGLSLRIARERAGLGLRETARRAKVSAPYLSDIELGRRDCPDRTLERIVAALEGK